MTHAGPFRNAILQNLSQGSLARLQLRPVTLEVRHPIETPGSPIRHIFFLETGIVSVTTQFKDGSEVEAGMFGCDSLSGISAFMGTRESLNAAYIQIAGHGYLSSVAHAAAEFHLGGRFQAFALRAVQAQLLQSMQSAGCNATHDVEQRLSRWLLLCADRTETDTLALSHEFMSDMLGSRRSTVTVAAGHLKDLGYIEYTRGSIRILNRTGLESVACECYRVLRNHLHDITQYDSGLATPAA
ncbi:Crp/Fnr family transcriptional regulator [Granulicella tundricola]|uniref:Putative transcriptional regulator, Crp/Fnr family n=1 Tax=Granulicella tundricola (strain ATCC BAA-1859 / DSM 23138 / MP5ACTX9) TaxID=1198114 RepID=E8WXB7_GRATM|nr:Crp/Fnr family transcriptional regulator [Granulicella tundricola]ADW67450.1 putative transcriptional regulator, Crp/Fnr family [Granulicella tundricola MP5ACTX9]